MRPHCQNPQSCRAKTLLKHCGPCQSATPETRAKRSAACRQYLLDNPAERQRRSEQAVALGKDKDLLARRTAKVTEASRRPENRARQSARRKAVLAEKMQDPAFVEALREAGHRIGRHNLLVGMSPELRAQANEKTRAVHLAWCPPQFWDLNRTLKRKGVKLDERKVMIAAEVERARPEVVAKRAIEDITRGMRERAARQREQAY